MSKLQHGSRPQLEAIRQKAIARFAPVFLHEALRQLGTACGDDSLDRFRKGMIDRLASFASDYPDLDDMKEFAVELLQNCIREVRAEPDGPCLQEDVSARRTQGRSERRETLEVQLQEGLEDSFPASDPPAVVSTVVSGARKP